MRHDRYDYSDTARRRRARIARQRLAFHRSNGGQGLVSVDLRGTPKERARALIILAAEVVRIENRPAVMPAPLAGHQKGIAA